MIEYLGPTGDPAATLGSLRGDPPRIVAFSYEHRRDYLSASDTITLHAVCDSAMHCVLHDDRAALEAAANHAGSVEDVARALGKSVIELTSPLPLETVRIPKPWGAEIWYTGIEERGVCSISGIPLPWILDLAGNHVYGNASPMPILLKLLDPLPDPVYGDLYFEMHEQKVEVYIVTDVDTSAWSSGTGAIRFGFDQGRISEFESLDAFKQVYTDKVREYRAVRDRIDRAFDERRQQAGLTPGDVVSPATMESWKSALEPALVEAEERLRAEMNAFTRLEPLERGDVVRVPPFTPHSLQHGVRVIEFQTPHYERYILSFAQKVLTQDHWDTDAAMERIDWEASFDTALQTLEEDEACRVELAADFEAFEVRRISMDAGGRYRLPDIDSYALAMTLYGDISVAGHSLQPERAVMLPAAMQDVSIEAGSSGCVLLATPKPR